MNKEQLLEVLKEDMKHWSAGALYYALSFVDDKCLCGDSDNDAAVARGGGIMSRRQLLCLILLFDFACWALILYALYCLFWG